MSASRSQPSRGKIIGTIYAANLFLAFHYFLVVYINSSYLEGFLSPRNVGILYSIGAFGTLCFLSVIPKLLRRYGTFRVLTTATLIEMGALFTLAFGHATGVIAAAFVVQQIAAPLIYFNLDILLEAQSKNSATGRLRGMLFTVANVALIVSIFITSSILVSGNYLPVYVSAALLLIPFLAIAAIFFHNLKDPEYETPRFLKTAAVLFRNRNLRGIFMVSLLLQIFYAFMVIYTPIYLHSYLHFSWEDIGFILTIMVLPFLLLEFPLGFLADKFTGEREMLVVGFLVMGGATALIAFAPPTVVMLATLLFMTRVGASFVEMMSESYFFKHIDGSGANILGFFRLAFPFSYIIVPPIASALLGILPYQYLFLIVGMSMLWGIRYALTLKDTK